MRKNVIVCSVILSVFIISPLIILNCFTGVNTLNSSENETVSVFLTKSDTVIDVDEREYIIGSVSAEMNADSNVEALKAQAIACYTFLKYQQSLDDTEKYNNADVSDNPDNCQGYIDKAERMNKWGDEYEEYEKKIEKVVNDVYGKVISYDNKPIMAVYHNLNCGKTESSENVWGEKLQYLISVESPGDKLSPDYCQTVFYSPSEFMANLIKIDGLSLKGDKTNWIEGFDKTDTGIVKSIKICGINVDSDEFRKVFNLKSSNFTIEYSKDKFIIKTYGSGHMVGMSQYGADYMAKQGANYREILQHYYQNTEII